MTYRLCVNGICEHRDFPHCHTKPPGQPEGWAPGIDDPVVSAPWPLRTKWEHPLSRQTQRRFFQFGWFCSHSKFQLPWKLNFDAFTDDDWEDVAKLIAWKFAFRSVYGIPRGGVKLAEALDKHVTPGFPVLIVDDALTASRSMEEARARLGLHPPGVIGVVVSSRGPVPSWVWPILRVSEWAQSRGTGIG